MKMPSAPQSDVHAREWVRKPANLINPVLSFPWPDILCYWQPASGGSFGQFVCVLIAM